jgi:uncharacterized membrane protein
VFGGICRCVGPSFAFQTARLLRGPVTLRAGRPRWGGGVCCYVGPSLASQTTRQIPFNRNFSPSNPRIWPSTQFQPHLAARALPCPPMNTNDISLLGWIHTFVCALALISGALQLAGRKGTPAHARRGNVYFLSMVIASVTALFIFHGQDVLIRPGKPSYGFGPVHWLAVITLAVLLLGRLAASRQRVAFFAYAHPICMIVTYWFLVGGAINEAFVRVAWVRRAALAISPAARSLAGYKLLYIVHFTNDAFIVAAIAFAVFQVRQFRRQLA